MKIKIFKANTTNKIEIEVNNFSKLNNILSFQLQSTNDQFQKFLGVVTYKELI